MLIQFQPLAMCRDGASTASLGNVATESMPFAPVGLDTELSAKQLF